MSLKRLGFGISFVFALSILSACDGKISTPVVTVFDQNNFPQQLNDWGVVFRQGNELRLNNAVIAYDLQTPLFSDYAHKLRTIWIPPDKTATGDPEIDLPVGSIVTKTFYYPKNEFGLIKSDDYGEDFSSAGLNLDKVRLIETRIMVHLQNGWYGLPYVWDDQQQNAHLEITGDLKQLTLIDGIGGLQSKTTFSYVVPDSNQCQGCHIENMNTKKMSLLGLKLRHLNKAYQGVFQSDNQLQHWQAMGKLDSVPQSIKDNVDWHDQSLSLETRARSYMDINCGHCHNPEGPADTSGLFLTNESRYQRLVDSLRLGVCKPPVAAGQGTGGRKVGIQPGQSNQSILSYRMESAELGAMMPELGRSLVHTEGAALINQWINAMPGNCQ